MTEAVLDASAVMALLQDEPGGRTVEALLARDACAISAVNVAEVAAKLADRGVPDWVVTDTIRSLQLEIHAFDEGDALASGRLRKATRSYGLSLGDRACLALADKLGLPAVTTDRVWSELVFLPFRVVVARKQ